MHLRRVLTTRAREGACGDDDRGDDD